jgi:hypothetical protein
VRLPGLLGEPEDQEKVAGEKPSVFPGLTAPPFPVSCEGGRGAPERVSEALLRRRGHRHYLTQRTDMPVGLEEGPRPTTPLVWLIWKL